MKKFVFSCVVSLAFISVAKADSRKTMEEYWKEVGWKFSDQLEPALNEKACYDSEKDFLQCNYAMNAMLSQSKLGITLVPSERVTTEKGFGKTELTFGPLSLVGIKKLASDSLSEIYEFNKKERALSLKGWSDLYADKKAVRVPYEDIIKWVTQQKFFTDNESAVTAAGVNSILAMSNDPHTRVTPTALLEEDSKEDNFVGIGANLKAVSKEGKKIFVVASPIEGGPAITAGIKAGDIITAVDGKKAEDIELGDLVDQIRGEKGTTVKITVIRQGVRKEFSIVRAEIRVENSVGEIVAESNPTLGYVKFRSFMKPTGCEDLGKKISEVEKKGAKAIIFDLRGNGGGLLDQAVCIGNLFLEKLKTVVLIKSLVRLPDEDLKTKKDALTKLPMVTLINSNSASASELVSGALQDYKRSYIMGDRSFGKGTVQTVVRKGKFTILKTIARFHLPSGRTNQIEGVIPDIAVPVVPNPTKDDQVAYREEDEYQALPALGKPWKQPRPNAVAALTKCMGDSGRAAKTYEKNLSNAIPPDYQLLSAVDAATCLANNPNEVQEEAPMEMSYDLPLPPRGSTIEKNIFKNLKEIF